MTTNEQTGEIVEDGRMGSMGGTVQSVGYMDVHPPLVLSPAQLVTLMDPIADFRVATRDKLSYVEAHDIKNMLIRIFGFGNFSTETLRSEIVRYEQVPQARDKNKMNWKVTALATVRLTIHGSGAVYQESAIAGSSQPDFTESADMAIKSSESDALKRCAIYLGTQFGLSLYASGSHDDQVQVIFEPDQWNRLVTGRNERAQAQQAASQQIASGAPASTGMAQNGAQPGAQPGSGMNAVAGAFQQ